MSKPIAVAILNYNGRPLLEKFLPEVLAHSPVDLAEIWVIDNASQDDSVAWLKAHYPSVGLVLLPQNYGFAEGYNRGLAQVQSPYYLLLNSDVQVSAHWLEPLWECLQHNPQVAACQPKIKAYHQPEYFEYAGAAGGYIDRWGYPFCRGRLFDSLEKDEGQYDDARPVFWASGACLLIRAEAFWEAGAFDTRFFAHMEEIDLCWRLKNLGYQIHFEPKSSVWHLGAGTLGAESPYKIFLNFRNNLLMLQKNLPLSQLYFVLFVRLTLDGVAALRFLMAGKLRNFVAILRAHFSFYRLMLKKVFRLRQKTWHPEQYTGSIVWSYFVRKHRKFSEISWN